MPTTLPRTQITHVPRVQRILDIGSSRWPDKSASAILIELAEERVNELATEHSTQLRNGILLRPQTRSGVLTSQQVAEILDDD